MKKLIAIILTIAMIMSFYSCTKGTQKEKSEERLAIDMPLNILLVLEEDLLPANRLAANASYKLAKSNYKGARNDFYEAKKSIESAKERIKETISSPNVIEESIDKVLENYDVILQLLEKNEPSDEVLLKILNENLYIEYFLLQAVQSFSNLYSIREFDQLSDEEAKEKLKEVWWRFRFEDDIECPKVIEKQELYLIWAKQFAQNQDIVETDEFKNELDQLRANDNLASKDYNKMWADFLKKFIIGSSSNETGAEFSAPVLYMYVNYNLLNLRVDK